MLVSRAPSQTVIDWNFTVTAQPDKPLLIDSLANIALPQHFIGRRKELRELGQALSMGRLRHLLITGPGGQGKTALAGQLARKLEKQGYVVHAYSARVGESRWENFVFTLQMSLEGKLAEEVDRKY